MRAEARRRILFVSPFPPHAAGRHGGARAIAQLLRRVAAVHDVAVLYLREESEGHIDEDLEALCEWARAVARPRRERGGRIVRLVRRARFLASLARGLPIWAQAVDVPSFNVEVERAVRDWRPDLVQFEYHVMGRYLDAVRDEDVVKVLVFYETGGDAAGRAYENASALVRGLDRHAWKVYERRILRRVQCAVVLTESDRVSIAGRGVDVRIETIPLGVEVPEVPADPLGAEPPAVLFVGNFRHDPNLDAALRLAHDIWPHVRGRRPDAVLWLVGESPPEVLTSTAEPDVEVHGSVESVEPYLANAAVCVAPLRHGGGMRVKVLEALAAGKAVVASPLAAAGLGVQHGRHLLVATTDGEFAAAILQLLDDADLRRALATAGRAWAVANADAGSTAAAFESLYDSLLAGAG